MLIISGQWLIIVQIRRSFRCSLWDKYICDGQCYGYSFSYIKAFGTAMCLFYDVYGNLVISFAVNICKAGPDEDDWMTTYAAFFGLFEQSFRGVHRLRLQLKMPPSEIGEIFFDDERLRTFLKPFDRLSKGREWTRLQLCVPDYYFQRIKQIKPGQDRWELTDTMWCDQSLYPVCLAFGL